MPTVRPAALVLTGLALVLPIGGAVAEASSPDGASARAITAQAGPPGLTPNPPTPQRLPGHKRRRRQRKPGQHGAGGSRPTKPSAGPRPLASTGFDLPVVTLLGLGILACGVGLRLRTVDAGTF